MFEIPKRKSRHHIQLHANPVNLLNLFTYKTPSKFAEEFKKSYTLDNLHQVRILSIIIFVVAFFARMIGVAFYDDALKIANYDEHSLLNWLQLGGACAFYICSSFALKSKKWNQLQIKALTLSFMVFVLVITFSVSYIVSLHNAKNTLTMFLIGIVSISLFFAVEYQDILLLSVLIIVIFVVSMVAPKVSAQEKIMNIIASVILGFLLISFSRYSYYFKSQHFVKFMELKEKNLEIERLNNQKGEILGFVAHDLRNPLNNIQALSQIMLFENEQHAEAKMISSAVSQAKEIINDLIEGVKSDVSILQKEKIDISTYLSRVIEKWNSSQVRKIVFDDKGPAAMVAINISKLERVLDNLINNALKFSAADKLVTIKLVNYTTHVCILVIDEGIGIPNDLQQYIFSQFSLAGRKGLKGENSIGLGLNISKKIVEQHNGQLTFESQENKGTTFTILLPTA